MARGPTTRNGPTLADLTSEKTDSGRAKDIASLRQINDRDWALAASDFWYFCRFVITEDEDKKEQRAFPINYQYLHQLHHDVESNQKVILLKSRRLMASWYGMLRMLHKSLFAGTGLPGAPQVFRGGVMSIGETEAKYLIQRISRVYKRLPEWMKGRNPLLKDNDLYIEFAKGGTVQAFPLKREGPQTFGFSEVFFDEMALQEAVRTVWTGLIPTLGAEGKLLAVSTPNGKGNLFYDIWSNKNDQYKGIHRLTLHWKDHPEHDQTWFDQLTGVMDTQMIARMFELSFAAYYGQPVWDSFNAQAHVVDETSIYPTRPIYYGWDFGYHFPAVTLWQRNTKDQWVGHRELQGYDRPFDMFCEDVVELANSLYDRARLPEIHCVPPDGKLSYRSRSKSGATNDCQQIRMTFAIGNERPKLRFSPGAVGTRTNEAPRLKEFRNSLRIRADGEPGLYLNKKMELFIEGCQGGYCYDEPRKGQISEEPAKNEYGHLQDSGQAVVASFVTKTSDQAKEKDKGGRPLGSTNRPRIGGKTGL